MTVPVDELIERLGKATGPSRELDCLLHAVATGYDAYWDGNKLLARNRRAPHDVCWLGTIDPDQIQRNFSVSNGFNPPIRFYTSSIDAAMTIVPEGWVWFVEWIGPDFTQVDARLWILSKRTKGLKVEQTEARKAVNPAIALSIAVLRAIKATQGGEK